uniref:Uncharacterized protein n=1 Tax=Anguilla anguilla TaxID=7936 RepID=A0A0E9V7V5_ANGAN
MVCLIKVPESSRKSNPNALQKTNNTFMHSVDFSCFVWFFLPTNWGTKLNLTM